MARQATEAKRSKPQIEALAERLRAALPGDGLTEKRMFGGIGFMLNGNMIAASSRDGLLLRVGKENHAAAMARPGTTPMVMRGRMLEGYLYVNPELDESGLREWLRLAQGFVGSLPPKS